MSLGFLLLVSLYSCCFGSKGIAKHPTDQNQQVVTFSSQTSQQITCAHTRPVFTYYDIGSSDTATYQWRTDNLKDFRNSEQVTHFVQTHYKDSPAWAKPTVFLTVADEKYIQYVETLLESFLTINILPQDFLVACLTSKCSEQLAAKKIRNLYYPEPDACRTMKPDKKEPGKRNRCILSYIKYQSTIDFLNLNINVFFLDLDVFIHKKFLPISIDNHKEIYLQYDIPKNLQEFNFGCYYIQSNNHTLSSFSNTLTRFMKNYENDQFLFNQMIINDHISYAILPTKQYYAFHFNKESNIHLNNGYQDIENLILTHMTCIEGAQNKALFGRELYGPPSIPSFYHPCYKTVSITYHADYSAEELAGLLMIAVKVCQAYGNRRLRVLGWDYSQGGIYKALYHVDGLFQSQNITMVESRYWENVNRFYPDYEVSRYEWKVEEEAVVDGSKLPVTSADDINVEVVNKSILKSMSTREFKVFVCNQSKKLRRTYGCLKTCFD
eukprot:gene1617-1711_t